LENGTAGVALLLDLNYGFGRGVVIFSKRLFIIVELLIILLVDGVELGLSRFVVSHIHVLKKSLALLLVGLLKESFNLRLHLLLLLGVASLLDDCMSHLDDLKVETVTPLSHEGSQFLLLIESGSEEFVTPEGSMHGLSS
jgi:hypothetical protein